MKRLRSSQWLRDNDPESKAGPLGGAGVEVDEDQLNLRMPERFQLRRVLGRGGMGVVYEAFDQWLGHEVALKRISDLKAEEQYRLKSEFRALANVVHPNLVSLYELVVTDDLCFFTMERILGLHFVKDVRSVDSSDPAFGPRLRDRARQLALAIVALHRAEVLHRDVKPSNVLVTAGGRVVLLDFGLLASFTGPPLLEAMAGTFDYMAPEQIRGEALTPAADWFSFGVTLYEALTGSLPYEGSPFEVSTRKRTGRITPLPSPSDHVSADIRELVFRLLHPEAASRPSTAEILACLGADELEGPIWIEPSRNSAHPSRFVNRGSELDFLRSLQEESIRHGIRVVQLHGPSGIGKTELVRTFLAAMSKPSLLALCGRCHPLESVPFNAMDRLIDDLAQILLASPSEDLAGILSIDADALVRVFPVLGAIGWAQEHDATEGDGSVGRVRRRAFAALRSIFQHLGQRHELVMWLDDVQWGDTDSGALLRELLRGPDPPRMFVILSSRSGDLAKSPLLTALDDPDLLAPEQFRALEVPPLDASLGVEVVERFAGTSLSHVGSDVERLVSEAQGSPFVLGEIGRYLAEQGTNASVPSVFSVGAALLSRTRKLAPGARRLLELIAVAGGPIQQRTLFSAAGLLEVDRPAIGVLERLSLVRTGDAQSRTAEIYHHRIRDQVLGAMSPGDRRGHCLALADAMVTCGDQDLQKVVDHYISADHLDGARRYVVRAATQAWTALAFDRAAHLYRLAIELGATDIDPCELQTRLGHALANAGFGRDAGRAFLRAAELLLGQKSVADPSQLLSLQRHAAEQFLKSGHDDEGVVVLHEMLEKLGVEYPATRRGALFKAFGVRALSAARGMTPTFPASKRNDEAVDRVDALWAVALGMGLLDHVRGGYFAARCFAESLQAGDPGRYVRGCAIEAPQWAAIPGKFSQRRAERMLDAADEVATRFGNSYDRGVLFGAKATVAWLRGDFEATIQLADAGATVLRHDCQGVTFELALLDNWGLSALAHLGKLRELLSRVKATLDDAELRNDRFTARSSSLGQPVLAWLALDRATYAMERADNAIAWWPGPEHTTAQYFHYVAKAQAHLYEGDAEGAHRSTLANWKRLENDHFLSVPCLRDELWHLRSRTELALIEKRGAGPSLRRGPKVTSVFAAARRLESNGLACGAVWAMLLRAGAHRVEGQSTAAIACLERGIALAHSCGLGLHREAARYALGIELRGATGESHRARAREWFEAEGVSNPSAMARTVLPGFGL